MKKYFQAPWRMKDLAMALLFSAIMFTLLIFGMRYFGVYEVWEESPVKSLYTVLFFALQWIIFLLPLIFVAPGYKKLDWGKFGFRKYPIGKSVFLILKGYFLYIFMSILILLVILYTNIRVPGYQADWSIFRFFDENIYGLLTAGFLAVIIGPFLEEIFFRGFILRTMCNRIGLIAGSILSAGIFAVLHSPWQYMVPVFVMGLIINSMVIKSKSLWPAIGFHVFNNAIAFTLQLLLMKEMISFEPLV